MKNIWALFTPKTLPSAAFKQALLQSGEAGLLMWI